MTDQKTAREKRDGDGAADKPKKGKQRRTARQIEEVRKRGEHIAGIVGAIIALSSIRWEVSSQTVRGLRYVVTRGSRGLICQCPANAGGKKDMQARVRGSHKFLEMAWWERPRRRIRIRRQRLRCRHKDCRSYGMVRNGRRRCKRKGPVQRHLCRSCGRTFSGIDGFVGRHFEAKVIIKALSMTAIKLSSGEALVPLKIDGFEIHQSTVARWSDHYSGIIGRYSAVLRVDAGPCSRTNSGDPANCALYSYCVTCFIANRRC